MPYRDHSPAHGHSVHVLVHKCPTNGDRLGDGTKSNAAGRFQNGDIIKERVRIVIRMTGNGRHWIAGAAGAQQDWAGNHLYAQRDLSADTMGGRQDVTIRVYDSATKMRSTGQIP